MFGVPSVVVTRNGDGGVEGWFWGSGECGEKKFGSGFTFSPISRAVFE